MSNVFKDNGARIGAAMLGVNYEDLSGSAEAFNVESEDDYIRKNATAFYKNASYAIASNYLKQGHLSEDFFVLRKLASTEEWTSDMQEYVDGFLVSSMTNRLLHKTAEARDTKERIVKTAAGPGAISSLLAGKTLQYTPSLMKSLLALGVIGGTAAGGLYWGVNRHLDEDSSIENDLLGAQVDEYHKMRKRLKEDNQTANIKTLADKGQLG
jgi:hypothetical protein